MQSLLVVGGDKLGDITRKLKQEGFHHITHLSGRKKKRNRKEIPDKIDIILVLTDYINHNLSTIIKREAQEKSIPIYFAKRSWSSICNELKNSYNKNCSNQFIG